MSLFNQLPSNDAESNGSGFSALAIGGAALLGLAGIGAASRAFRGARGANWGELFGTSQLKGLGDRVTRGTGFPGQWKAASEWLGAKGMGDQRLTAGLLRGGALATGAWAGSYVNPFVGAGEEGSLSGTIKTGAMALGAASAFSRFGAGKGGGWNRIRNWKNANGPAKLGASLGGAVGDVMGAAKSAGKGFTTASGLVG